jgi:hypothetical protein
MFALSPGSDFYFHIYFSSTCGGIDTDDFHEENGN